MQKKKKYHTKKISCAHVKLFSMGFFCMLMCYNICVHGRKFFFVRETFYVSVGIFLSAHTKSFLCTHEKFLVSTQKVSCIRNFSRAHEKLFSMVFFFNICVHTQTSVVWLSQKKKKKNFDYVHRKTQVVPCICTMVGGQEYNLNDFPLTVSSLSSSGTYSHLNILK